MSILIKLAEETIEKLLPHVSLGSALSTVKEALARILAEADETIGELFATVESEELALIKSSIARLLASPVQTTGVEPPVIEAQPESIAS